MVGPHNSGVCLPYLTMTPLPKLEESRERNGLPRPPHKLVVELIPINQPTLNKVFLLQYSL